MLMTRQKQALAKSQPVNSWNQPSVDEVASRMRAQDVAYGQKKPRKKARGTAQRQFLRSLK